MLPVKIFYLDFFLLTHTSLLYSEIGSITWGLETALTKVKISSPHLFINCNARRNLVFQSTIRLKASLKSNDYTLDVAPTKSSAGLLETAKISFPRLNITQLNFTHNPIFAKLWWNTFHSTTKMQQHSEYFGNCCCWCFIVFSLDQPSLVTSTGALWNQH